MHNHQQTGVTRRPDEHVHPSLWGKLHTDRLWLAEVWRHDSSESGDIHPASIPSVVGISIPADRR